MSSSTVSEECYNSAIGKNWKLEDQLVCLCHSLRQDGTCTALDTGPPRRSDPSVSTDNFCASSLIIADLFAPVLTSYCTLCCILPQNHHILTFFLGSGRSRLLEAPALQTVVSRHIAVRIIALMLAEVRCHAIPTPAFVAQALPPIVIRTASSHVHLSSISIQPAVLQRERVNMSPTR